MQHKRNTKKETNHASQARSFLQAKLMSKEADIDKRLEAIARKRKISLDELRAEILGETEDTQLNRS